MARVISSDTGPTERLSPWAEDNLMVDDVLEATERGLSGQELLDNLAEVAGARYQEAERARPHQPMRPTPHDLLRVRPYGPHRDPMEGELGAVRHLWLHRRYREGQPGAPRAKFRDAERFLAQVAAMS